MDFFVYTDLLISGAPKNALTLVGFLSLSGLEICKTTFQRLDRREVDLFSDVQFDKGYVLTVNANYDHFYTGFLFAEYQYRVNKWFGIGANLTILGTGNTEYYHEKCQVEDYYTKKRNH